MRFRQEEISELKKIVNDVFLVDLETKSRKRNTVDARKVYSKILRDSGYCYQEIGDTINKDHATVLHYVKDIDHILFYDSGLREKYIACKNVFVKEKNTILEQLKKDVDAHVTVIRLTNELQEAIQSKKKILYEFVDYIEKYEKQNGYLPSINDYRYTILPLFNK